MAPARPSGGIRVLDECFNDTIEALLACMAAVEHEMAAFHVYITTEHAHNKPLVHWPKYTGYRSLARATEALDDTVERLRSLVQTAYVAESCIRPYVSQARSCSVKVSNATASAMEIMGEKTKEYDADAEKGPQDLNTHCAVRTLVADDLAELIKHSTAATNSVWAAVDLLGAMSSTRFIAKANANNMSRLVVSGTCCAVIVILLSVVLFKCFGTPDICVAPQMIITKGPTTDMDAVILDIKNTCSLVRENMSCVSQIRNIALADHQRLSTFEQTLQSTSERIDNIWEALGPPNVQGTYYTSSNLQAQLAKAQSMATDSGTSEAPS